MVGGVVSTTVTVWLHCAWLLQQFCTSQVRVMTCEQAVPLVTVPAMVTMKGAGQPGSVTIGSSKLQLEPHSTVLLVAQVMLGTSITVTVWLHVMLLLQQSVACQFHVMTSQKTVAV